MWNVQNYDDEFISTLMNSINEIHIKNILIELPGFFDEDKLRFLSRFDNYVRSFKTNNIISNDVSHFFLKLINVESLGG